MVFSVWDEAKLKLSPTEVYNTFPWPDRAALTPKQVQAVEQAAQQVLDARTNHEGSTLADLYDPLTMPADLRKAHNMLDRAVDALYGLKVGSTEAQRLALLLTRYQKLVPTLDSQTTTSQRRKRT
ncbi:type IIL restriction-modification enzyme MmeI [Deinococcus wulumuqiensis]